MGLQRVKSQSSAIFNFIFIFIMLANSYTVVYLLFAALPYLFHCLQSRLNIQKQNSHQNEGSLVSNLIRGLHFLYAALFRTREEHYLESTHHEFEENGSTYTVKRGIWQTIFTRDSKNIKHILAEDFKCFELPKVRVSAMKPLLGNGIFSLNGASWSHARKILKPCFANRGNDGILAMLEQHFQAFEQRVLLLNNQKADHQKVDLQPLFFCLAMDFATEYLMGTSSSMLNSTRSNVEAEQFVTDYMTCSEEVVAKMSLGPLQQFRVSLSAMRANRRIFNFMDKFVEEAQQNQKRKNTASANDFLTELSSVTSDRKVLRDQMLHVLVASRDTIASLLSNLFFMLAKNPEVYSKLRASVLDIVGDRLPSAHDLKQIEYLKWCIQECKFTDENMHL